MNRWIIAILVCLLALFGVLGTMITAVADDFDLDVIVLGYNDLGMHCMNQDFSEFMILPPYNTLHAQVIDRRGGRPVLVTEGIEVAYGIPGNTTSADKTNFWAYVQDLLGVNPPPDTGLTGNQLAGSMVFNSLDWVVTGIPLTPQTDQGLIDPFQLARITVRDANGEWLADTQATVPVSWELRCDFCHTGMDAPLSVLDAHDQLHGTALYSPGNQQPVLCGGCHAQPELGLPGEAGVSNLSRAMHNAHSSRMMDVADSLPKGNVCYACHPGPETQCLRDVHARMQMQCGDCHAPGAPDPETMMLGVANPERQPWTDMPRCDDCHHRQGYEYEQPGLLFKNSFGHGGIACEGCHNSTHAITPSREDADNIQNLTLQHYAGSLRKCTVCHAEQPKGKFQHRNTSL